MKMNMVPFIVSVVLSRTSSLVSALPLAWLSDFSLCFPTDRHRNVQRICLGWEPRQNLVVNRVFRLVEHDSQQSIQALAQSTFLCCSPDVLSVSCGANTDHGVPGCFLAERADIPGAGH